jgi:hypothetical protein
MSTSVVYRSIIFSPSDAVNISQLFKPPNNERLEKDEAIFFAAHEAQLQLRPITITERPEWSTRLPSWFDGASAAPYR